MKIPNIKNKTDKYSFFSIPGKSKLYFWKDFFKVLEDGDLAHLATHFHFMCEVLDSIPASLNKRTIKRTANKKENT